MNNAGRLKFHYLIDNGPERLWLVIDKFVVLREKFYVSINIDFAVFLKTDHASVKPRFAYPFSGNPILRVQAILLRLYPKCSLLRNPFQFFNNSFKIHDERILAYLHLLNLNPFPAFLEFRISCYNRGIFEDSECGYKTIGIGSGMHYGSRVNDSQCLGFVTEKCLLSVVRIFLMFNLLAIAITDASTSPRLSS